MKNKLTEAEKEIMEILWTNENAFMKDLLIRLPEPKPAATTVATNLKRMQNKDLIGYRIFGNSRQYFPKVKKEDYFTGEMTSIITQFFNSSVSQFASFFTNNSKLSQKQLKELREIIDNQIKD